MRHLKIGAAGVLLAAVAGAAQAEPTYRPEVTQAFKDICMTSLTTGKSVEDLALGKGWQLSKLQPASGSPTSKTWSPPGMGRLFVSDNLLAGGQCEAGYYGGAALASKPGLDQQMVLTVQKTTRALQPMGWRYVGDEGKPLIWSVLHTSAQYPDKAVTVWVANFPAAPTLAIYLGPKP